VRILLSYLVRDLKAAKLCFGVSVTAFGGKINASRKTRAVRGEERGRESIVSLLRHRISLRIV